MKKNNRELNQEHDQRQSERVRPPQPYFDYKPLEAVIRQWVKQNEQT